MTEVVATMLIALDSGMWPYRPGAAVGGYPYCAAAPGLCSVGRNRGVEEENA